MADLKNCTVTINECEHARIEVVYYTRNPSSGYDPNYVNSGDTVQEGTDIYVNIFVDEGYEVAEKRVEGAKFVNGTYPWYTVQNNVTINIKTAPIIKILTVKHPDCGLISVYRSYSEVGASTGYLHSGDQIYNGDHLQVSVAKGLYEITQFVITEDNNIDDNGIPYSYSKDYEDGQSIYDIFVRYYNVTIEAVTDKSKKIYYYVNTENAVNTIVTINRTYTTSEEGYVGLLKDGDPIFYNDVLIIKMRPNAGYKLTSTLVTGIRGAHENFIDVRSEVRYNVVITTTTELLCYKLSINDNIKPVKSIVVIREDSPLTGNSTRTELADGDDIYHNDVLTITTEAQKGFVLPTMTYDGLEDSDHISPVSTTTLEVVGKKVVGDVVIDATDYILIAQGTDPIFNRVWPELKRISSPLAGAPLTIIGGVNNNIVYTGDVLKNRTTLKSEDYQLNGLLCEIVSSIDNNVIGQFIIQNNETYTVPSMEKYIYIAVTPILKKRDGLVSIDNGTSFEKYMIYIDNGTSWDRYLPYIDNGSDWDLYN